MSFLDRLFGRQRDQPHRAAVYYVTVPDVEPYYVAICECGWFGDILAEEEPAFGDARAHTTDVDEELQYRS